MLPFSKSLLLTSRPGRLSDGQIKTGLRNSALAYWGLEETGGNRADLSGNGRTLTDVNTVLSGAGRVGTAASFDAAFSEYLFLADHPDFELTADKTLVAWYKPIAPFAVTGAIFGKWVGTGNQREYIIRINSGVAVQCVISPDGTSTNQVNISGTTAVDSSNWNFLVITWNEATSTFTMQNTPVSAATRNGIIATNVGTNIFAGTGDFGVGSIGTVANLFNGLIDEAGVFNRILTAAELDYLFQLGKSGLSLYP